MCSDMSVVAMLSVTLQGLTIYYRPNIMCGDMSVVAGGAPQRLHRRASGQTVTRASTGVTAGSGVDRARP